MSEKQANSRVRTGFLYQRWLDVVAGQSGQWALWDIESGQRWTFEQLRELGEQAGGGGDVRMVHDGGLAFFRSVLQAWHDDAVLLPLEAEKKKVLELGEVPAGVCHIKLTSGSTGSPRPVLFSAEQLLADVDQIVRTMGLGMGCPNFAVISMAHSYGFSNLVLPLLLHGIPMVIGGAPLPGIVRADLAALGRPVVLPAVPAMWRAWYEAGVLLQAPIAKAISAGAPLPLELEHRIYNDTGLKVHNFYGASECGGIAYDATEVPRDSAEVAGRPLTGVNLALDDTGCLVVESPAVAIGYADGSEGLGGGRYSSRDIATIADDGTVSLVGRADDIIHVAGRKVAPARIESALLGHDAVRDCVVFGTASADSARVDDIVAVYALERPEQVADLRGYLARHLAAWEMPRYWWHQPDLRPDRRGKISRAHWKAQWEEERKSG